MNQELYKHNKRYIERRISNKECVLFQLKLRRPSIDEKDEDYCKDWEKVTKATEEDIEKWKAKLVILTL